jgi:hypothetical protein
MLRSECSPDISRVHGVQRATRILENAMNLRLSHALAAALASGAAAFAIAQAPAEPAAAPEAKPTYLQESAASVSTGATGPTAAIANSIVEALNAERSLQGSKFSVVPGDKGLYLSGVTSSLWQMALAIKLAEQHGGGIPVTSAISTEEVIIDAGVVAPEPQSMVSADEAIAASERDIAARAAATPQ